MNKKHEHGEIKDVDSASYLPGKPSPINFSSNSVIISWQPPISIPNGLQRYEVQYKSVNGEWESVLSPDTNCQVTLKNLKSDTVYHFKVRTVCDNDESPFGDLSEDISFSDIEYEDSHISSTGLIDIRPDQSVYTHENQAKSQCYEVHSVVNEEYSRYSEVSTTYTKETAFKTTDIQQKEEDNTSNIMGIFIQEFAADVSSIKLKWKMSVTNDDITHYEVRYKKSNDDRNWLSASTNGSENNIAIQNLEENTKYDFIVRAIFETNDGQFSHPPVTISTQCTLEEIQSQGSSVVNKDTTPGKPSKIDSTTHSICVQWTHPPGIVQSIDRYELRFKESDPTIKKWKSKWTDNDETVLTMSGLQANTSYDCKVRTILCNEDGPFGETIKVRTESITFGKPSPPEITESTHCMIILTWQKPKDGRQDINHYELRYNKTAGTDKWKSLSTEGPENKIQINNLQSNSSFECKVRAIYCDVDGPFSDSTNVSTKSCVEKTVQCTAPIPDLITTDTLSLSWDPPSNSNYQIDCYEIRYNRLDQVSFIDVRTAGNQNRIKIMNLNRNTKYDFKIRAIINGKPSSFSSSLVLTTLEEDNSALCLSSPPCESGVTAESVSLRWGAPVLAKDQINCYEVRYREKKEGVANAKWQRIHTKTNETKTTITQLKSFTKYEFCVRAVFEESVGKFNDQPITISTQLVSNDPGVPYLKESKQNQLTLQWDPPNDITEIVYYDLRYKELNKVKWIPVQTHKTEETVKDLSPERFYEFKVRAVFNEHEGQFSKTVKFSTIKLDSISPKADLKTGMPEPKTITEKSLVITWKPPLKTKDLNCFELRYKVASAVDWHLQIVYQNEITLNDLNENTVYEVKVRAFYEDEQGPFSDISILSTLQRQRGRRDASQYQTRKPEDIFVSCDSITIKWHPPLDSTDLDYYDVHYKEVTLDRWVLNKVSEETKISFNKLKSSVNYEFKVRAVFVDGQGPFSDVAVIKTKHIDSERDRFRKMRPGKPTSVRETSSNICLEWFADNIETSLVKHYELNYRVSNDLGKEWTIITTNRTNETVNKLKPSTQYEFKVRAIFQYCEFQSSFSKIEKVKTKSCTAEQVRQTSVAHDSMGICWKPPENDMKIRCYKVAYKELNSSYWEYLETEGNENRMTLIGLKDFTEYEIQIHTIFSNNNSACSETFSNFLTQRKPPTTIPGQPMDIDSTSHTITLDWSPCELENFDCYEIRYRECGTSKSTKWTAVATEVKQHAFKVPDLKSGTDYEFKVAAVVDGEATTFGDISPKINTKLSLATLIRDEVDTLISDGPPARYKLPVLSTSADDFSKTRKCRLKHQDISKTQRRDSKGLWHWIKTKTRISPKSTANSFNEKTIMLVGATGSGKSTLIDGMINYITDVSWEDDFRFSLIDMTQDEKKNVGDETVSQTEWITTYKIPCLSNGNLDYTLNIVDTPGFGDTRGITRDKKVISQMNELFQSKTENGIQTIDGVCFVTQSPLARLTPTQKYIFDAILSMFGKDIANNIFVLITFADGKTPPVLDALNKARVPFNSHFKFNNSALFEPNTEPAKDKFARMFWQMGEESFKNFFAHLKSVDKKSLQLTADVLRTRNILEVTIEGLQRQVTDGMNQLNTMRQECEILKRHRTDIEANKNFDYEVDEVVMTEIPLDRGQYVTNCLKCNFTCHFPCFIADDGKKQNCKAMAGTESCNVCSQKCHWQKHRNATFRLEALKKKISKTYKELKEKYEIAQKEAKSQTDVLHKVRNKFIVLKNEVADKLTKVRKCINDLDKFALKPNPLSDIDYINLLIQSEEAEVKYGWQNRVKILQSIKKGAEVISQAKSGKYTPFESCEFDELLKEFDIQ